MIVKIPLTATVPLTLERQPEGGYTVTSPLLPELITEGDTIDDVLANVQDCFAGVVEIYEDLERPLPEGMLLVELDGIPAVLDTDPAAAS